MNGQSGEQKLRGGHRHFSIVKENLTHKAISLDMRGMRKKGQVGRRRDSNFKPEKHRRIARD